MSWPIELITMQSTEYFQSYNPHHDLTSIQTVIAITTPFIPQECVPAFIEIHSKLSINAE